MPQCSVLTSGDIVTMIRQSQDHMNFRNVSALGDLLLRLSSMCLNCKKIWDKTAYSAEAWENDKDKDKGKEKGKADRDDHCLCVSAYKLMTFIMITTTEVRKAKVCIQNWEILALKSRSDTPRCYFASEPFSEDMGLQSHVSLVESVERKWLPRPFQRIINRL